MSGKRGEMVRRQFLKATGGALGTGALSASALGGVTAAAREGSHTADRPLAPEVIVLPAFEVGDVTGDTAGEFQLWYRNYDLDRTLSIPGAASPLYYTDDGLAVLPTGMGKSNAATTVASMLSSPRVDAEETVFLSAGIAGTPPDVGTLGAVFVSDAVVDWDLTHRWSRADGPADPHAVAKLSETAAYYHRLDDRLVRRAFEAGRDADLVVSERAKEYRRRYDAAAARRDPFVGVGTTVCGDTYWHGATFSEQAAWICETMYDDVGTYSTTEMEDFGTATAIARHGHLDRYVSVRSVSNFDQPYCGQSVEESLAADSGGFAPGVTNAFRVGSAIVDAVLSSESAWGGRETETATAD